MSNPHIDPWNPIASHSRRAEGVTRQMARRQAEDRVRGWVVALCNDLADHGRPRCHVAKDLHLSPRTLWRWRWRRHHGAIPRGRPRKQSPFLQRRAVLAMLEHEGRHVGLPSIRSSFPDMPRCELRELQTAYRQHYRATHRKSIERLAWQEAGSVWATDHVVPPNVIDGVNQAVLAVRDLASGAQLAWQPVPDQTTSPTTELLKSLLVRFGKPLVLKSDNGPAFISQDFGQMLDENGITWLPSPPRMPWYNGSCEAGNGSLRTRTDHFAQPTGDWTAEALEAALRQANELTRPQNHKEPTHRDRWLARKTIPAEQRAEFRAAVERHRQSVLAERKDHWDWKNKNHQRQVQRQAVRRALLELGLLTTTRRSISPPLKSKKLDRIS